MVGFRATEAVTKEDFEPVMKRVKESVERNGKLNYLLVLDTSPKDFTTGAWFQDGLMGIKNLTRWNRAAVISDSEAVINFTAMFSKIMPGEFRGFHKDELQDAIDWTAEKTI